MGDTPNYMCIGDHGTWTNSQGQFWDYMTWKEKTGWSRKYIVKNYPGYCLSFAYPLGVYTNESWLALYSEGFRIGFTTNKDPIAVPPIYPWEFLSLPRQYITEENFNETLFMKVLEEHGLYIGFIHPWEKISIRYLNLLEKYNITTMTSDHYYLWSIGKL